MSYPTVAQLTTVMNALATKVREKNYEQKANLKALAYKDEVAKTDLAAALQTEIDDKVDSTDVDTAIATQIGSVYKPGGSLAAAGIANAPTAAQLGYVYNMSEDFTTNANFTEGAGKPYTAGTDVAVVVGATEGTYLWNVLSGFIDQTQFANATEFANVKTKVDAWETATDAEINAIVSGISLTQTTPTP